MIEYLKNLSLLLLFISIISYIMGSFAALTFDITLWSESLRFSLAMFITFIGVIYTLAIALDL